MNSLPRLRLYALALHLYPAAFRARYAEEMLDTARHEFACSSNPLRYIASLAADTVRGVLREHLRAASPTRPGYVAAFALFFTFLLIATSVVQQQILRRAADQRPWSLASFVARQSPQDPAVTSILSGPRQEISSSAFLDGAQPFAVLYDGSGRALTGNATLHGSLPQPPHGIFNVIQQRGRYKVTWQPQAGIRVALTGLPLPGGGFVLAGQSLISTESRYIRFHAILLWMWAIAMLACLALVVLSPTRKTVP